MSVKYRAMTCSLGTREKAALTAMGRREVTAIWTGRKIHQMAIQTAVPTANPPFAPSTGARSNAAAKNPRGPKRIFVPLCVMFASCRASILSPRFPVDLDFPPAGARSRRKDLQGIWIGSARLPYFNYNYIICPWQGKSNALPCHGHKPCLSFRKIHLQFLESPCIVEGYALPLETRL